MGKQSNFPRRERDFYPTPRAAVLPLIPGCAGCARSPSPCCGDGALVRHLESFGLRCVYAGDIADGQDALAITDFGNVAVGITVTRLGGEDGGCLMPRNRAHRAAAAQRQRRARRSAAWRGAPAIARDDQGGAQ